MIDSKAEKFNSVSAPVGETRHYAPPTERTSSQPSDTSTRPFALAPNWDGIPAALRALPQWCAWEWRFVPARSTWAKVPLRARCKVADLRQWPEARTNDPRTWASFDAVRAMFDARTASWFDTATNSIFTVPAPAGPGFVFVAGGGLVGVDLDRVRDPETGTLAPIALEIIGRLGGYWELSPSQTGLKGYFYGQLPEGCAKRAALPGGGAIEVYDRGRYFAVTGHAIPGSAADLTHAEQLPAVLADFFPAPRPKPVRVPASDGRRPARTRVGTADAVERARAYIATIPGAVAGERGHDRTFTVANHLVKGFALPLAEAADLLAEWNTKCSPPWTEDELDRKIRQASSSRAEVGYLLERESTSSASVATPAESADAATFDALADLIGSGKGPVCSDCVKTTCPRAGMMYGCESVSGGLSVGEKAPTDKPPETTDERLRAIVGPPPARRPCKHARALVRPGVHNSTYGKVDIIMKVCGRCGACQSRVRYAEKLLHVSAALKCADRIFHESDADEWGRIKDRISYARSKAGLPKAFPFARVIAEGGRRFVVLAAELPDDEVPEGLVATTAEQAAKLLAASIDAIPYRLPKQTRRIPHNNLWKIAAGVPEEEPVSEVEGKAAEEPEPKLWGAAVPVPLLNPTEDTFEGTQEAAIRAGAVSAERAHLRSKWVSDRLVVDLPEQGESRVTRAMFGITIGELRLAFQLAEAARTEARERREQRAPIERARLKALRAAERAVALEFEPLARMLAERWPDPTTAPPVVRALLA